MPVYPAQERHIDPFSDRSSFNINQFSKILTRGKNVIFNIKDFQVSKVSNTVIRVTEGECIIDNVYIKTTSTTDIDISDPISFYSNGAASSVGKYYLCIDYKYSKSRPAPQAGFVILKPNEHGYVSSNNLLFIAVINIIDFSGVYVVDTIEYNDSDDLNNGQRRYPDLIGGYYNTLPTFDPDVHPGMIIYEETSDSLFFGTSTAWTKLSSEPLIHNTSTFSVGDVVYIDDNGNLALADETTEFQSIGVVLKSDVNGLIGNNGIFDVNVYAFTSISAGDDLALSPTGGKIQKASVPNKIIGKAVETQNLDKVKAFIYSSPQNSVITNVTIESNGTEDDSLPSNLDYFKKIKFIEGSNISLSRSVTPDAYEITINNTYSATADVADIKSKLFIGYPEHNLENSNISIKDGFAIGFGITPTIAGPSIFDGRYLFFVLDSNLYRYDPTNRSVQVSGFSFGADEVSSLYIINNFIVAILKSNTCKTIDRFSYSEINSASSTFNEDVLTSFRIQNRVWAIIKNPGDAGLRTILYEIDKDGNITVTDNNEQFMTTAPSYDYSNFRVFATTISDLGSQFQNGDVERVIIYGTEYNTSTGFYNHQLTFAYASLQTPQIYSVKDYYLNDDNNTELGHIIGLEAVGDKLYTFLEGLCLVQDVKDPYIIHEKFHYPRSSVDNFKKQSCSTYFDGETLWAALVDNDTLTIDSLLRIDPISGIYYRSENPFDILSSDITSLHPKSISSDGYNLLIVTTAGIVSIKKSNKRENLQVQNRNQLTDSVLYERIENTPELFKKFSVLNAPSQSRSYSETETSTYIVPISEIHGVSDEQFHWMISKDSASNYFLHRIAITDWNKHIYSKYGMERFDDKYNLFPPYEYIYTKKISIDTAPDYKITSILSHGGYFFIAYTEDLFSAPINVEIRDRISLDVIRRFQFNNSTSSPNAFQLFPGRHNTFIVSYLDKISDLAYIYEYRIDLAIKENILSNYDMFVDGDFQSSSLRVPLVNSLANINRNDKYVVDYFLKKIYLGPMGKVLNGTAKFYFNLKQTYDLESIVDSFFYPDFIVSGSMCYSIIDVYGRMVVIDNLSGSTTVLTSLWPFSSGSALRALPLNSQGTSFLVIVRDTSTTQEQLYFLKYELERSAGGSYSLKLVPIFHSTADVNNIGVRDVFIDEGGIKACVPYYTATADPTFTWIAIPRGAY